MAMRLEIAFARPLDRPTRLRVLSGIAALAGADSVGWRRGHQAAVVTGEALDAARLRAVLREEGVAVEAIRSSLADAVPVEGDEVDENGEKRERVRPPGR